MDWKFNIILALINFLVYVEAEDDPTVCFTDGCVRGVRYENFDAFMGIPFAKPPINELRFKNPVPVDKWSGYLNATTPKNVCVQKNVLFPNPKIEGTEDCLYLYVYRPNVSHCVLHKLPVMVYIYGGGFFAGIAAPAVDGPDYFMESKKVIMVFMAYRVAALGFLSTGDEEITGNFGLKDQALAIQWTAKNIEFFGGDPNKITVLGQSAGAASTHFHLLSPLSQNLIHRVIFMSGSAIAPYDYVSRNPRCHAVKLAVELGILNADSLTSKQLADELRKIRAEDIIAASERLKYFDVDPLVPTLIHPVIEKCEFDANGKTSSFLCDDPRYLWKTGKYQKVPILTGFSDIEGGVRALSILENNTLVQNLNKVLGEYLPLNFDFYRSSVKATNDSVQKIFKTYLGGKNYIDSSNSFGLIDIFSDRWFIQPLLRTVQQFVNLRHGNKYPIYIYKFNFTGPQSYSRWFSKSQNYVGVIHCDELIYTLRSPALFPDFAPDSYETKFRKLWIDFLVNFAINGEIKNAEPCTEYDISNSTKCPYIYFGRPSPTANETIVQIKYDLPLRMVPFWDQIEGSDGPVRYCDVFANQRCPIKYCC